jgi:hypothetical protein
MRFADPLIKPSLGSLLWWQSAQCRNRVARSPALGSIASRVASVAAASRPTAPSPTGRATRHDAVPATQQSPIHRAHRFAIVVVMRAAFARAVPPPPSRDFARLRREGGGFLSSAMADG